MNVTCVLAAVLMVLISLAQGSPIFDIFFGNSQGGYKKNTGRRQKARSYTPGGGYNEYKRICKTINPDPYAFIGSNPYPAAPVCPP